MDSLRTHLTLQHIVVRSSAQGATVYLKDIAEIRDTIKETENFARLGWQERCYTQYCKNSSGENLINAADKVKAVVADMRDKDELPKDLKVVFTGDQSKLTKNSFNDLVNTIVIGFLLVLIILMFFMGVTNAFFCCIECAIKCICCFHVFTDCRWYYRINCNPKLYSAVRITFGLGIIVMMLSL